MNNRIVAILLLSFYLTSCRFGNDGSPSGGTIDPPEPHTPFVIPETINGSIYYVDYESGNDGNDGLSPDYPWKHAPGDRNATGNPLNADLQAGDAVYFKGGVSYYGSIDVPSSGTASDPIRYVGNAWGTEKAVIDGSTTLSGWSVLNENIFYTDIPAEFLNGDTTAAVNLHEDNPSTGSKEYVWTAQWPKPTDRFFYDEHNDFKTIPQENLTLTSLTDPDVFNQSDADYWNGSSLLIWTNPNRVILRKITEYFPAQNTVTFESLHDAAIYPDGRDQSYALYNSIHALDQEGEYCVDFESGRVYLYPRRPENIETSISMTAREYGIDLNGQSGIVVEGFVIRNHGGNGLRSGIGIGTFSASTQESRYVTIRDNEISHNSHHDRGYGGIYIGTGQDILIENNTVSDNFQHRGIFIGAGNHITVRRNTIERSGSTSIGFYGVRNSEISYNTVLESKGGHANGITVYIASYNVLIACNRILESNSPMTFQDSGNLYFFNNLVFSTDGGGVNEWGRTSRGPWSYGEIVFINNTFIRTLSEAGALNTGNSRTEFEDNTGMLIEPNSYLLLNNIIDGGSVVDKSERDYNCYSSLLYNQNERYGWELAENEWVEENLTLLFSNHNNGDFSLPPSSPAKSAGEDPTSFLPMSLFPDFDFYSDIDGQPRQVNGRWSLGAFE